jgi:circadian clock protein KaiC
MTEDTFTAAITGSPPAPLPRLPSGIAGVDEILLGGFVKNGLYIIQGTPGAGKTMFGNQVCYANVAAGGRAIYVTLLSEQHERMLANLAQLSFFDPEAVARDLTYLSAFQLLERDGLPGLLTLLRREIVSFRANVLVVDGLLASEAHAATVLELKKFVQELQMLAGACDCTMFLLTSGRGSPVSPEHTMVDGMIEIGDTSTGWRTERHLAVRKFRGSDFIPGAHAMRITSDGIVVWPRTEGLPPSLEPVTRRGEHKRVSTGIEGLDDMLRGGLPRASSTLVMGPTGTGKTVMGLRFLSGCTQEAPGLMLGFYETPAQIMVRAEGVAPDLPTLVQQGIVGIQWQSPSEDLIDRVGAKLIEEVRARRVRRLLIDGLLGFQDMTVHPDRMPNFYRALTNLLRGLDVTILCTMEVPELIGPILRPPVARLTPLAENLILLRYVEHEAILKRLLSIMKVRDSEFDHRLRNYTIDTRGILLGDDFGGAINVLTGFAAPAATPAAQAAEHPVSDAGEA